MNELVSIFIIFPSLDCQVLMTHAEGSPYGIVLISSWNQVDLFKMFSCKSLEKKLAVIWVSKQSQLFSRTHTEIILDLLTWASSFDGSGSSMFSDTKRRLIIWNTFVQKKSCVEPLLKRQARIQLGPKEPDKAVKQSVRRMDTSMEVLKELRKDPMCWCQALQKKVSCSSSWQWKSLLGIIYFWLS